MEPKVESGRGYCDMSKSESDCCLLLVANCDGCWVFRFFCVSSFKWLLWGQVIGVLDFNHTWPSMRILDCIAAACFESFQRDRVVGI